MSDLNQGPEVIAPPAQDTGGLTENVAGLLAYLTILPAILFLVLEPYNRNPFIRFHAFQCLALTVVAFAVSLIAAIPILGWLVALVMMPVLFVCWILCMAKAYNGRKFKLPILGSFAENLAK